MLLTLYKEVYIGLLIIEVYLPGWMESLFVCGNVKVLLGIE